MRYLFRSIAPTFRAPLLVIVVLLAGCTSPGSDAPAATIAPAPATEVATTAPTTEPPPTNELTPTLVPEAPTVEPETPAAETPVADPPYMDVLCTTVPRPALGLFIPGDDYLFIDPLSGTECDVSLPADMLGPFQAVPHSIFYAQPADGQTMVNRMFTDGVPIPLDFTAVASDESSMHYNFVVSADGSRIAWAAAAMDAAGLGVSRMWTAGIDGADAVAPLPDLQLGAPNLRVLAPVRFSADNSTLFYTLQPVGLGGSWIAFNGRYDNLYALRLGTEAQPELIFDCATIDALLCIGDFSELDGSVNALVYTNPQQEIVFENGQGQVLNTFAPGHEFVGYPTLGPAGDMIFYGADLASESEGPPTPEMGYIYRVAPPTAPSEVLAADPGLLFPAAWLDDTQVVVNFTSGGNWGVAIVALDGSWQALESAPNAVFVDVLPE